MGCKLKDFLLLLGVWVIFIDIPIIFSYFGMDYKSILVSSWWLYAGLFIITISYILYPQQVKEIFYRICAKKIEDTTGVSIIKNDENIKEDSKDIKELKKEVQKTRITIAEDSDKIIEINSKDKKIIQLSKDFSDGKYEKIILDAKRQLISDKQMSAKKEFCYRVFMEFAYSQMSSNQYNKDDRINNLKNIIDSNQSKNKTILFKFMLMLSQCYLQQYNFSEALKISYQILHEIKKDSENYSSNFLTNLYSLQARILISQDRPIYAILAAKEGIKFADDKHECDLCYLISNIYFNYLNNTTEALSYALKSWSLIYSGADYQSNLVSLCYFSYFFEKKYKEAAEFLENYTITEKTEAHYANLSYLLYKTKQFEKAKEYAEKAIEKQKEKAVAAKNTLAMLAMDAKNYEKGIYLLSEILPNFAEDKDNYYGKYFYAEILYNRGKCYTKLGNYLKANDDINEAINAGFDNIEADLLEELEYNITNSKIGDKSLTTIPSKEKMEETDAE